MTQAQTLEILKTGANVFLSGEPGSGKTHTIREYVRYLRDRGIEPAITASTGIAATHIGGMTIHSWSGIGIKEQLSPSDVKHIAGRSAKRIKKADVLIIDEVSMLEGNVLDLVDMVCKTARSSSHPFGGMQVVLVGDFFQLPPVTREGELPPKFAFDSQTWNLSNLSVCYLSEQYRQSDLKFSNLLAAIRSDSVLPHHREHLDGRLTDSTSINLKNFTKLFPHNKDVDHINSLELEELSGKTHIFSMEGSGPSVLVDQLKRGCLSPEQLKLKEGAVVMFTKNKFESGFVNGTLGTVVGFYGDNNYPVIKTKQGKKIFTEPMEWTIGEDGEVVAGIRQIPLRLAWALTIHKSQGTTLDAAFMDLREAFVEGQGYVALSRLKTLDGLYLAGYNDKSLKVHSATIDQDKIFRERSIKTESDHKSLPEEELIQLYKNFIFTSGGNLSSKNHIKTYSVDKIREEHANAYKSWHKEEEESLTSHFNSKKSIKAISILLGRKPGAITSRLKKLGLIQEA